MPAKKEAKEIKKDANKEDKQTATSKPAAASKPAKAEAKASKGNDAIVKSGDKVKVDYTGSFDDGKVFDSSEKHGAPLEFECGKGLVIPGFENAILGMKVGKEKTVHLDPKDAYGDHNPQLIKKVPREQLPKDQEPKAGMILMISLPNGAQFPARLTAVEEKEVTLDLNHPLAGKCLNFKFKIVGIN